MVHVVHVEKLLGFSPSVFFGKLYSADIVPSTVKYSMQGYSIAFDMIKNDVFLFDNQKRYTLNILEEWKIIQIGLSGDLLIHPGETLREVIDDRDMKQNELAQGRYTTYTAFGP
jgi:hypothetical protein